MTEKCPTGRSTAEIADALIEAISDYAAGILDLAQVLASVDELLFELLNTED